MSIENQARALHNKVPEGSLPDRKVPACPRCGHITYGWPTETVGLSYAGCTRCGKLFNR